MDRVILGDNQFFGINHMSEVKAQAQAEKFGNLEAILDVIDAAYDAGIRGFMFNTHDRVRELCDYFRAHPTRYSEMRLYPSLPYAHKYSNAVNEKGLISAMNDFLLAGSSAGEAITALARGGLGAMSRNVNEIMKVLVDLELRIFRDLNVQTVFLQNIIADMMLGFGNGEILASFHRHVYKKYGVEAAVNSMNMPAMVRLLQTAGVENPIVCSSINKTGYLMTPDKASYEEILAERSFRPMAMSVMASGAIPVREAVEYVVGQGVESIVFGASTPRHIEETRQIIEQVFDERAHPRLVSGGETA